MKNFLATLLVLFCLFGLLSPAISSAAPAPDTQRAKNMSTQTASPFLSPESFAAKFGYLPKDNHLPEADRLKLRTQITARFAGLNTPDCLLDAIAMGEAYYELCQQQNMDDCAGNAQQVTACFVAMNCPEQSPMTVECH
jgi:hypothetical protein